MLLEIGCREQAQDSESQRPFGVFKDLKEAPAWPQDRGENYFEVTRCYYNILFLV
jgi:hypothetical protein